MAGGDYTSKLSVWIMEFVLRQPIENWLAHEIINALPLPSPPLPSSLYTTVLLRRLASLLSRRSFTYGVLETLELLHSISSKPHAPSLAPAYAAAALHVVAKVLRHDGGEAFCEVADVLFKGHIGRLERSGMGEGLISAELVEVKGLVERAAAGDARAREEMLKMDSEDGLIEKLRTVLKDSAIRMGPSFLEVAAQAITGSGVGGVLVNLAEEYNTCKKGGVDFARAIHKFKFNPLPTPMVARVQAALKTSREELRRVVYDPLMDAVAIATFVQADRPEEHEVNKNKGSGSKSSSAVDNARECEKENAIDGAALIEDQDTALLSSFVPLDQQNQKQLPVKNTMDNAAENAHNEGTNNRGFEKNKQAAHCSLMDLNTIDGAARVGNQDTALLSSFVQSDQQNQKQLPVNNTVELEGRICPHNVADIAAENAHNEGTSNREFEKNKQPAYRSLMDWNPTAQTHEWDDSINTHSQESPDKARRFFLPSPNKRTVSPLKLMENQKFLRRRRVKKWGAEEEEALREAVKKYGKGNWKTILNLCSDVFQERTEVDLKDKWRNMTRY